LFHCIFVFDCKVTNSWGLHKNLGINNTIMRRVPFQTLSIPHRQSDRNPFP
jgi:hypothetical protein